MKLYMAITNDRLELPLCVEESPTALATMLGIHVDKVYAACVPRRAQQSGKQRGYRIIRIETDEKGPALQREPKC